MIVFINKDFDSNFNSWEYNSREFINYNKSRYNKEKILDVLKLLKTNLSIRGISRKTNVPETTIRNWKYGYTNLYGTNNKLSLELQNKILNLLKEGKNMPEIANNLSINYNTVRIFIKNSISLEDYGDLKIIDKKLKESSKKLTKELAYVLGVIYGDGSAGKGQIRLGTKDKDFVEFFIYNAEKWSRKEPGVWGFVKNNKPYFESYLYFKDAEEFINKIINGKYEIPEIIKKCKERIIIINFIKGFSDSEGSIYVSKENYTTLKLANQNTIVLSQIKDLMVKKLNFNENKLKVVFNNKAKNGGVYVLRMCYKDQIKLFYETIGFTIKRKQIKLENLFKSKKFQEKYGGCGVMVALKPVEL